MSAMKPAGTSTSVSSCFAVWTAGADVPTRGLTHAEDLGQFLCH